VLGEEEDGRVLSLLNLILGAGGFFNWVVGRGGRVRARDICLLQANVKSAEIDGFLVLFKYA
jgi:hypothetical protein